MNWILRILFCLVVWSAVLVGCHRASAAPFEVKASSLGQLLILKNTPAQMREVLQLTNVFGTNIYYDYSTNFYGTNYDYSTNIFIGTGTDYDPTDAAYGAIPNDDIDDTPAFQLVSDAIGAAGGGKIKIPPGVFIVDAWRPTNNWWVEGSGWGTTILKCLTNGTGTIIVGSTVNVLSNVVVNGGIEFWGMKSNSATAGAGVGVTSGSVIRFAATNGVVRNCLIWDAANAGINLGYAAGAGVSQRSGPYFIEGNVLYNCGLTNTRWGSLAVAEGEGIWIARNRIYDPDGGAEYGIDIEPDRVDTIISGISIIDNKIYGSRLNVVCNERQNNQVMDVDVSYNLVDSRGAYDPLLNNTAPISIVNVRGLRMIGNTTWPLHVDGNASVSRSLYLGHVSDALIALNIFNTGALTNSSDERVVSFDGNINFYVRTNGVISLTNDVDGSMMYTNNMCSTNISLLYNIFNNTNSAVSHRFGVFAGGTSVINPNFNNIFIGPFDTAYYVGSASFSPQLADADIGNMHVLTNLSVGSYDISGSGLRWGMRGAPTSGLNNDGQAEGISSNNATTYGLTVHNLATTALAGVGVQFALHDEGGPASRAGAVNIEKVVNTSGILSTRLMLRTSLHGTLRDTLILGDAGYGMRLFSNGTNDNTEAFRIENATNKLLIQMTDQGRTVFFNSVTATNAILSGSSNYSASFFGSGTLSNANVNFYDSGLVKRASITDEGGLDLSTNLIGSTRSILIDKTSTPTFETRVNGVQGILLSMGTAGLIIDATNNSAAFTVRYGSPLRTLISAGSTFFNMTTNVSAPLFRVDGSGGSAASPGIGFYGNLLDGHGGMGMYKIGPGTLGFSTANVLAITVSSNQAVTFAGRHIHPTVATQTLAAGSPIVISAKNHKVAGSGGAVTLTSTPTIAAGSDGEEIRIIGTHDTNTLTIQDHGTLAGSLIQLSGGATTRVLGKGDVWSGVYVSADGFWYETGWNDN